MRLAALAAHAALASIAALAVAATAPTPARACTSIVVSRGASADGSVQVTYAADSHSLYGELYFTPAKKNAKGAEREIREWDSGRILGKIPQPKETYKVVGNMNEHQVVIGETTWGGRKELVDPEGKIDYGSLIYVTLERAKTAREAIRLMDALAQEFGYASSGETFSIADTQEAWLMEMIGKGPKGKGAVWVARKVPDGFISAHANQPRIRQFPQNDPENTLFSRDVITFAREKGWFTAEQKDEEFSFADTYGPTDWETMRACEARVWSVFRRAAPSQNISYDWLDGVPGAQMLPLWIKPDAPVTAAATMALMRDHYEGTKLDLSNDVGAGPYRLPYRWRPMRWTVDGATYVHERAISTQQTGFSFVSQSRANLPNPVGGLLWFGVDDTYSTVYVPIYVGIERAPKSFAVGTGSFTKLSWDAAFWVFNRVANQAYGRYSDQIVDIIKVQRELEGGFLEAQPAFEQRAAALYAKNPRQLTKLLTQYSAEKADGTVERWRRLGDELFVKYLDGNVRGDDGKMLHPAYEEAWYRRIVQEAGDNLRTKRLPGQREPDPKAPKAPEGVAPPKPLNAGSIYESHAPAAASAKP